MTMTRRPFEADLNGHSEILPAQFFNQLRFRTARRGERRLALAVLEDAYHCLERGRRAKDFDRLMSRWEAERWFESRDARRLFSYENVCDILEVNAAWLRKYLHRWLDSASRLRASDSVTVGEEFRQPSRSRRLLAALGR